MGAEPDRAALRDALVEVLPDEIAFDIDGVVADTFHVFVDIARREYGYGFDYEDITEYEFLRVLDMDEAVSEAIIQALLDHPVENGIMPMSGAVGVLTRLAGKTPLLFVTARPEEGSILGWVYHHLPSVDPGLIRLAATNTHETKPLILREWGVRFFVEDRLETCHLLEREAVTPILFDQPWNRRPHPFHVVRNWDEISALIKW